MLRVMAQGQIFEADNEVPCSRVTAHEAHVWESDYWLAKRKRFVLLFCQGSYMPGMAQRFHKYEVEDEET